MSNAITTLVGEELEIRNDGCQWTGPLAAPNGFLYGIPAHARRAIKFDPVDKSITPIGPDFGNDGYNWWRGTMAENGVIYCPPEDDEHGILKIDTNTDDVTELDVNLFPERGDWMWACGHHVLLLSMDAFTSCLGMLVVS